MCYISNPFQAAIIVKRRGTRNETLHTNEAADTRRNGYQGDLYE